MNKKIEKQNKNQTNQLIEQKMVHNSKKKKKTKHNSDVIIISKPINRPIPN